MDPRVLIGIIVILAILVVVAIVLGLRKRRREHLKQHFGREYDRAVQQHGTASRAEAALEAREQRVHKFTIRDLPASDRGAYADEWAGIQRRFVDDPSMAVTQADRLVTRVMTARGYPMGDFDQRAEDVSVSYPDVVDNYRAARDIVVRHGNGQASTEDLRQAMVYYRSLFDELLGSTSNAADTPVLKRAS
jgi:type II secretory pathway pseudopilin PulG